MGQRGSTKKLWIPETAYFWERVNTAGPVAAGMEDGCWVWCGGRLTSGYGIISPPNSLRATHAAAVTHRVAWQLVNGPIPPGKLVLHRCDVRACCRPSHLFLGDDKANMDDKYRKGRGHHARGERAAKAKLTETAVLDIRAERAKTPPTPLKELAARHGVSLVAVSYAAAGKTWAHVQPVTAPRRDGC